jgi:peptide/nickel transport system substrate-binding protein
MSGDKEMYKRSPNNIHIVLAILLLVSFATAVFAQDSTPLSPRGFIEPPFLADRVASGELPPIDERLPEEPFVVGPGVLLEEEYLPWEDGQYGGDIQIAAPFPTGFVNIAGGATILRSPGQSTQASSPNVVSELTYNDDFTSFTFTIRAGLKWSDGAPVTTEDVRFTFEDLYQDPDVQRGLPSELYTQGNPNLEPAQLTIVDDLTFTLTFSQPYGFFAAALNSWIPYYDFIIKPAHYLKQFHAKYANPDELAALITESNQSSWVQLLNLKDAPHWDIGAARALGMPTLNAWVLTEINENQVVYERNPFFWHVDSSGRQLPYTDRVVNNMSVDGNAQTNAILAGQVSIASGGEVSLNNMPVYIQAAERNNLNVFTTGSFNSAIQLFLNYDYQYGDEASVWQQLINDPERRFAKAITAAINPDDINQTVYFGQYGAPNDAYHYSDPELANQLLDEIGLNERDEAGFRLGPDGQRFVFTVTHSAPQGDFDPVAELLKEQIDAVGIQMQIERVDGVLFDQRKAANEIMASLLWNDLPAWRGGISRDYQPASKGPWSPLTWLYFTSQGEQGREPDAVIQAYYDLDSQRQALPPESTEGLAIYDQMMEWFADNYVFIPLTGPKLAVNVVDGNLRNVPVNGAPIELDTYIVAEGMWFAGE